MKKRYFFWGFLFCISFPTLSAQEITVNLAFNQPAKLNVFAGNDVVLNSDSVFLGSALQVKGGTPPYRVEWKTPEGYILNSQIIYTTIAGKYEVIVTDASNCKASDLLYVIPLNIMEKNQKSIDIFPSPATTFLIIKGIDEKARLEIYNILGKKIFFQVLEGLPLEKIALPVLPTGEYLIRVVGIKNTFRKKIIIQS
ncbi:MAG: T9SS type A sorting domain-containing protein [Bacteroidales bacterium]